MPEESETKISAQEHIRRYYEGLEQLEKKMKLKRQETHMKAFGAGSLDDDKGGSSKLKEMEAQMNAERARNLALAK